jgi:hypothetical protein
MVMWKKIFMAYFKILSYHVPGETGETNGNWHPD